MEGNSRKGAKRILSANAPSFAQLSAYLSVGFVTLMFLVQSNKTLIAKQKQMMSSANLQANYIYDPDHGLNISHVCLSAENIHQTKYKDSPCVNKTFIGWYNPWARHHFWKKLWKEKDEKRRERQEMEKERIMEEEEEEEVKKNETDTGEMGETAGKPEGSPKPSSGDSKETEEKTEEEKAAARKKEKQLEMLYSILISLLLLSSLAACWEVIKERVTKNQAAALKAQEDHECTLANFTINRHLRRESQQQNSSSLPRQGSLELRSKVTKSFIHQSSLDRASPKMSSEALNPGTERRYSVPAAFLGNDNPAHRITTVPPTMIRVQRLSSIDVTPADDVTSDARKKPRHFIRRH